jgi:hypothetical protein
MLSKAFTTNNTARIARAFELEASFHAMTPP